MLRAYFTLAMVAAGATVSAADWPQWRGPERDGKSPETGLPATLPAEGPPLLWKITELDKIGTGYGSPAIVGNRLYIVGGDSAKQTAQETIHCLDATTGQAVWSTPIGSTPGKYLDQWGGGPRGTPTVDGDKLYVLGATGDLVCAQLTDGKVIWTKNLVNDFAGKVPTWGYSESPLVDGDKVVVTPGEKGSITALNKTNGELIWTCADLSDPAGYSSLVPVEIGGVRQYVTQTMEKGVGVRASDGKLLWRVGEIGRRTAVIPTPVITPDGYVLFTAGYGAGCEVYKLTPAADNGTQAEKVFSKNTALANHHGGVILLDGKVYGHSDRGGWMCLDIKEGGEPVWKSTKLDKGSITYADGHFYCYGEVKGTLVQIQATPEGWEEQGRFDIPELSTSRPGQGKVWAHPVIADGKLYLRDYEKLFCYELRKSAAE